MQSFQNRVQKWMNACFGEAVSADKLERGDRYLEETFELLQSVGYPRERIRALEDYVYSRPVGDPPQEAGGVMVTLAAFCEPHDLDMHVAGENELVSCWGKIEKIRAKQATKPHGSALPIAVSPPPQSHVAALDRVIEAAREVIASASDTYKKRNGHLASFEDDSGEKCWIVPFDAFEGLRSAVAALAATATEDGASIVDENGNTGWVIP
ncbi:Hypothetical protein NGAL_HAMBI1146_58310 [Neorhizobium galegae bv. officinalis]|nr:Hypothetical protein NGAL_HAMBI1146_58310 [Neorhizobium galegae bv. officinalis]